MEFFRRLFSREAVVAPFLMVSAACAEYALADKSEVVAFFGTERVKVVFVSEKRLYFVDFGEAAPRLREISAAAAPVNPVISPEGTRVAYASGKQLDGDAPNRTESAAWICDMARDATPARVDSPAFVPRFIQNAPQPTLLYADSGCGDSSSMKNHPWNGCGRVWKKNTVSNEKSLVWDKGSWYGGLSHDGKWLATAEGLKNAFLIDITAAVPVPRALHTLRVIAAATGKDTLLGFQTCNPSVSSSRIFFDAVMYLDIGVRTTCGATYTIPALGEESGWEDHTRIFISRSGGAIARYYRAPAAGSARAGTAWAYPEWSNHPYFAAAALEVARYWSEMGDFFSSNERLYAIRLHDSAYLPLLTQTNTSLANLKNQSIKWPWLWVETPDTFALIEDKAWLDRSMGAIHQTGSPAAKMGRAGFTIKNGLVFFTSEDITEIKLFSPSGRLVQSIRAPGEKRPIALRAAPGAVIVRCVRKRGGPATAILAIP